MKNFTLTAYFLFALAITAVGQNGASNPVVDQVSTELTRSMADQLALNENDYIKIKALNQQRLTSATEAAKLYADDEAMRISRLAEIEAEYEEKLFKMLNGRQVAAYAEFKEKPEASFVSLVQKVYAGQK